MKFILSDESINKYGFRVLTSGLDIEEFKKNPVMFYNHNRNLLPIGKWINIQIEKNKLVAEPEFDADDEFAMQIKDKVDKGILNATSIGFNVIAISEDSKDLVKGQTRPTVIKAFMFEASIVDIPANGGCMKLTFLNGITLSGDVPIEYLNSLLPKIEKLNMSKVALSLGLKADATEDEILAAMNKKETDAASQAGKDATSKTDDKVMKVLLSLAESKGMNKVLVEKLAKADFDAAYELVNETKLSATEPQDNGRLSDLIETLKAGNAGTGGKDERQSWTLSDWEKKDSEGLYSMIKKEPAKYQKLFAGVHGFEPSLSDLQAL